MTISELQRVQDVPLEMCGVQMEKLEWLSRLGGVALSSDAFFPFADNVHRASQVISLFLSCTCITFIRLQFMECLFNGVLRGTFAGQTCSKTLAGLGGK